MGRKRTGRDPRKWAFGRPEIRSRVNAPRAAGRGGDLPQRSRRLRRDRRGRDPQVQDLSMAYFETRSFRPLPALKVG
jgi:hypothetical protein